MRSESLQIQSHESPRVHDAASLPIKPERAATARALESHAMGVGIGRLIGLIYLQVCGGPFGSEPTVSSGGPVLALLAPLVLGFTYSLPVAMLTTELSTAMPHDGGYVLWTDKAFGHFWSYQTGLWNVVGSAITLAVYPNMITDYISHLSPDHPMSFGWKFGIHFTVIVVVAIMNVRGSHFVGGTAFLITIVVLLPFFVMLAMGFGLITDSETIFFSDIPHHDWGLFISLVLWNQSGWDNVSLIAGEVKDPHKTYFPAMVFSLVLVSFTYFLPLFVGIGVDHANLSLWKDGYFTVLAGKIARGSVGGSGRWFEVWMAVSGCFGAFGMEMATMLTTSRNLFGMSLIGIAPQFFGQLHPVFYTPWITISMLAGLALVMSNAFEFGTLVKIAMCFYGFGLFVKYATFLYLRYSESDMHRPYRMPFGLFGCALAFLPGVVLSGLNIFLAGKWPLVYVAIITVCLICSFYLLAWVRGSQCIAPKHLNAHGRMDRRPGDDVQEVPQVTSSPFSTSPSGSNSALSAHTGSSIPVDSLNAGSAVGAPEDSDHVIGIVPPSAAAHDTSAAVATEEENDEHEPLLRKRNHTGISESG